MKKIYFLLISCCLLTLITNAQVLLASYPLTSDLHDSAGNNGDFVLEGGPSGPSPGGVCESGVYYESGEPNAQNMQTALIGSLAGNSFEIDFQFLLNGYGAILIGGIDNRYLDFGANSSSQGLLLANNAEQQYSFPMNVSLGQWYSASIKYVDSIMQISINSQVVLTQNVGTLVISGDNTFLTNDYGNGRALNGCLKEMRIYNSPVILQVPDAITESSTGDCGTLVSYSGVSAYSDSAVTVTYSPHDGSFFTVGSTTVYVRASSSVATVTDSFVVTVVDSDPPSLTCNADVTDLVADPGSCSASGVFLQVIFGSDCEGLLVATNDAPSEFHVGTTTVTWTVTGHNGQTATCPQKFTVLDKEAPNIDCPGDMTVNANKGICLANVNFGYPTAIDNCNGAVPVFQITELGTGAYFPVGKTEVAYTATDRSGNTDTCRFTITVVDAEAPVIHCPNDTTVNTLGRECSVVVNYNTPTATDNCSGTTLKLIAGQASGSDFLGGANKITYVATDASGNTDTCSFNVIVNVTHPPTWYYDYDGDGYYGSTKDTCSSPGDKWSTSTIGPDCNDSDASVQVIQTWYLDADGDGYYVGFQTSCNSPGPGYTKTGILGSGDCDDNNPAIHQAPDAPLFATGPQGGCKGQNGVTFSILPVTNATSYTWTLPTGATGTSTGDSITANFTNAYTGGTVCVKSNESTCSSVNTCKSLALFTKAPAAPGVITGPTGACGNTTYNYSVTAAPTATYYNWNPPADATVVSGQGTTTASIYFNSKYGGGTLLVKAFNCIGAGGAQTLDIGRTRVPSQPGDITGQKTGICGNIYAYSIAQVNYASLYSWTIPAGCLIAGDQTGNSILLQVSDDFDKGELCVTAVNKCGLAGPAECAALNSRPASPSAISGPASVCKDQTGVVFSVTAEAGITNTWSVPTGCTITSGQGTASIHVSWGTLPGTVSVNAANICGIPSGSVTKSVAIKTAGCTITTRLEENQPNNNGVDGLTVFPNPNKGIFEIQFAQPIGNAEVNIFNSLGQRVFTQTVIEQKDELNVSLSSLPDGIYFVRVLSADGVEAKRFVITK